MENLITHSIILVILVSFLTGFISALLIISTTGWIVKPRPNKAREINHILRQYIDDK